MTYNKRPSKMSSLPGSSIKGAGALPPGTYKGFFEVKRLPGGMVQQTFVSMPHGFHILEAYTDGLEDGKEYTLRVALSDGGILARTDGGRYYIAHAHSKEALTSQHADVHECLIEAASKKLKMAQPEVVLIKEGENVIYQRDIDN